MLGLRKVGPSLVVRAGAVLSRCSAHASVGARALGCLGFCCCEGRAQSPEAPGFWSRGSVVEVHKS